MNAHTMSVKHFDLLTFVKKSKKLGVSEVVAEYQGRQIEEAIEIAVATSQEAILTKQVATQQDLKGLEHSLKEEIQKVDSKLGLKIKDLEIKMGQMRNQMLMWMTGLLFINGVIAHFLK